MASNPSATPEGVFSILDMDLYKLTMQYVVRKFYPDVPVTYSFSNRTPHMKLSKKAFAWLEVQVSNLANIGLSPEELSFLQTNCAYLNNGDYLTSFLPNFRFDPASQVILKFHDDPERAGYGDVELGVKGLWHETILYEILLLALASESYFKFVDTDWSYDGQETLAYEKSKKLIQGGAPFAEFGTRRRRDYATHDRVMKGLIKADRELREDANKGQGDAGASKPPALGKFLGTSNVHFAMKYGVMPVGTMAHEWFMGIAAATQDYSGATATALSQWMECFGRGTLDIALTDTFGTPVFLKTFETQLPKHLQVPADGGFGKPLAYADAFSGIRQDSGDPKEFIKVIHAFCKRQGISRRVRIVFSDSLTVDNALVYKRLAEEKGFTPSFGIGTYLTNDFMRKSTGEISKPLNIVIKISSAGGHPAIKLSDDLGKNTGDSKTVERVKEQLGYDDNHWNGADEADRYGKDVVGDDLIDKEEA